MDGQVDQSDSSSPQIETDQTSELAPGKNDFIDANSVTDEATAHDSLDFEPYVNALAEFLISPKTQPPLTLAIEGEWGGGMSSFTLQLQDRLNTKRAPKHTIVCFNPWRYEKQDELWAAFALKLTRTLREKATVPDRFRGDIRLFFKRIKGFDGWANFVTLVLLWVVASTSASFASQSVTDEVGRTVTVPDHPHRIICLVASITGTVFALGGGDDIVAVRDCVKDPAETMKKPSVGSISNPSIETSLARLFEPLSGQGSGVATLPFPVSPPMLPEGWMLAAATASGSTSLTLSAPTGGSEGEPDIGMAFSVGSPVGPLYTVMAYQPADPARNKPASLSFFPSLAGAAGQVYPICTKLYFQQGPSPAGWVVSGQRQQQLTLTQGTGIPDLGDTFTVGSDTTVYTITAEPTVTMTPANLLQVVVPFSPKPTKTLAAGQPLSISPPQISPRPIGWQINSITPGATGKPSTLAILNGTGAPLIGDQFTVGRNNTVYTVTGYTAATSKALAQLNFIVAGGGALPSVPQAFCSCCTLNFTRPAPLDWAIGKSPKIGANQFTVSNHSGAASGVIDIGYTFMVQGDKTVYTVRLYDQTSGVISFLPDAETAFQGEIVFSPPLKLTAASPGFVEVRFPIIRLYASPPRHFHSF